MANGFSVDPAGVQRLSVRLDSAGEDLYSHLTDLADRPDAGRSSDEVGAGLELLALGLAALGQHVGSLAEAARACADEYRRSDEASSVRFAPR